ncbi:MafI family immunity protein [Nocardia asteroides]|uniref:MafI family immunity protein n=1 Tax=Nocardia asteroides TaxID=1824 RepID=UPI001E29795C|nr:MafI family immunity protein [Nocardia asteroides]UGT57780.1 MafI family immunity protein [Nocardia asteroides]
MDSDDRPSARRKRRQLTPEQKARYVKMGNDSAALLERFANRLRPEVLAQCKTYSEVGEWTLLIDNLCASLVKEKISISPAERDALADLMALFGNPNENSYMVYIDSYERVLEELNVSPE